MNFLKSLPIDGFRLSISAIFIAGILQVGAQVSFANLGDYVLENGQTIEQCKIGYRTFGQLNEQKTNAILFPTWYGGTSESLISYIGPDQMLDSSKYYVIIVDALGDGVSSSPSNSPTQSGRLFPEFTIRDMVNVQYKMLTEELGINHLYAITGISMGGMQTFQWMASYPDFFDLAAPIVGSPALTSYDMLVFELFKSIMKTCDNSDCGDETTSALMLEYILGTTPQFRLGNTTPGEFPDLLKAIKEEASNYNLYDLLSQMNAISNHDITVQGEVSLSDLADNFKNRLHVTIASKDLLLNPTPSKLFAQMSGTELLELETECGHYAFACEQRIISDAIRNFLK